MNIVIVRGELNQNYNILLVAHKCIMMNYDMLDFALCNSHSSRSLHAQQVFAYIMCTFASSAVYRVVGIHFIVLSLLIGFFLLLCTRLVCRYGAQQCSVRRRQGMWWDKEIAQSFVKMQILEDYCRCLSRIYIAIWWTIKETFASEYNLNNLEFA